MTSLSKYESDRVHAWKAARTMSFIGVSVSALTSSVWYVVWHISFWQWYAAFTIHAIFAVVEMRDRRLTVIQNGTIFFTVVMSALFANTLTNIQLAERGMHSASLVGYKIVPIIIAILAPAPFYFSYSLIVVVMILPAILYYWVFTPEFRALFPTQEPWLNWVYGLIGLFLLRHRLKGLELERKMMRLSAERRAVDELAQIFLILRDMTNTPLQNIELTMKLLESGEMSPKNAVSFMEKSLIRLRALSQILASYEKKVNWDKTSSAFDAEALLNKKLAELQTEHTR